VCPAGMTGIYKIEDGVGCIEMEAFHGCAGLTEIHIPDSVWEIHGYEFSGCTNATVIMSKDSYAADIVSVLEWYQVKWRYR